MGVRCHGEWVAWNWTNNKIAELPMIFGTYNLSKVYPSSDIEVQASKYIQGEALWDRAGFVP